MLASKVLTAAKSGGSTWWSLDQESDIYLTELTWHVLVSLGILDPYVIMLY